VAKKTDLNELDIITLLFFHSRNFHAYVLRLLPHFFADEHQDFFEVMQKHYKAYGKVPSKKVYEVELNGKDKDQALAIWDKVYSNYETVKHLSHDYIADKLGNFAKGCYLKEFIMDSYDNFEQGKYDKIISNVAKLNDSVIDNDLGEEYHDEAFVEERYNSDNYGSYINTGFSSFDDVFGGWYRKALHIIAGPSNSGKTLWLINFVANLLLNTEQKGIKILYITLEIDEAQVGRRLDASFLDQPMSEIAQYRDVNLREKIAESKDTRGNRLMIKEMPGYKTTPSDIEAVMRNLEITSNGELKPDIVFVDYIGLLSPSYVTKNMGLYEKGLAIAVELRSLAQRYNIPFLAAAQTNRSSFEDRVGQDKIADSIGISQTCDMLMTINRNDELDEKNHANIYLAKSRFCKNGELWLFSVNYENMRVNEILGGTAASADDQTTDQ